MTIRELAAAFAVILLAAAPAHAATVPFFIESAPEPNDPPGFPNSLSGYVVLNVPQSGPITVTNWNISFYDGLSTGGFSPFVGTAGFGGFPLPTTYGDLFFSGSSSLNTNAPFLLSPLVLVLSGPIDGSVRDVSATVYSDFDSQSPQYLFADGTVTLEDEEFSAVPLPPALPMFGVALLALAGFAAWSRRKAVG